MAERCELVVLVDEDDRVVGTAPKATVHTAATPLHRGFSLFLFNAAGEVLVTRRARSKTFAGVWSNSVCGHPAPGESAPGAAQRRLGQELGLQAAEIREVAPFRYRCADAAGVVENEICPIVVGLGDGAPSPDRHEVADWTWVAWEWLLASMREHPQRYSPWSREEALILDRVLGARADTDRLREEGSSARLVVGETGGGVVDAVGAAARDVLLRRRRAGA